MKIHNKSEPNYITLNDDQLFQVKKAYDLLIKNELDMTAVMMLGIVIGKVSPYQMLGIMTNVMEEADAKLSEMIMIEEEAPILQEDV